MLVLPALAPVGAGPNCLVLIFLQRDVSSDSDSELEMIDCPRRVRQPRVKHRRILDSTNVLTVPIYTGR
ncbi:hypothetical protein chiPu_0024224, partial [Chiloscyllium punctatum]|nr:hypothetical protein [Chiloscyllium punctatum]